MHKSVYNILYCPRSGQISFLFIKNPKVLQPFNICKSISANHALVSIELPADVFEFLSTVISSVTTISCVGCLLPATTTAALTAFWTASLISFLWF